MKATITAVIVLGVLVGGSAYFSGFKDGASNHVLGDVNPGSPSDSTTTPQVADLTSLCGTSNVPGVLDSIHIFTTNTGDILLLDATTSNVNKRTGNIATSSLILAWVPPGMGTSTTHFGIRFKNGLLVDYTGTAPTSTISYRCGN